MNTIDLIPQKLCVSIHEHVISTGELSVRCLSYLSQGLWALGQRELLLSFVDDFLMRERLEDPLAFFELVYHAARTGLFVDVGDLSRLGDIPLVRGSQLHGLAYLPAQRLALHELPANALCGVALMGHDEVELVEHGGPTRLLARLAAQSGFVPYPPFNDVQRSPLVAPGEWSQSFFAAIPSWYLPHARCTLRARQHTRLSLRHSQREQLVEALPLFASSQFFALRTGIAWEANGMLLWTPGQRELAVVQGPFDGEEVLSASALILARDERCHPAVVLEDALLLRLDPPTMARLWDALLEGRSLALDELTFELDWVDA